MNATEVPRVDINEIAQSFHDVHSKLLLGDLPPRPFWLQIGDSGYKITDENRNSVALGMMLCLDVRGYFGR